MSSRRVAAAEAAALTAAADHRPRFPERAEDRLGIGILGAGQIARTAHLPAYAAHGLDVAGVWSRRPEVADAARVAFPFVRRCYRSPEELLADPEVGIVDIATPTNGRVDWVEAAVDAGKHVLAQKPLSTDPVDLPRLDALLARAAALGVLIAVNHNGRWAPPWRAATQVVRSGAVGEVVGVTHLHDKPLPPLTGTPFDQLDHMLLTDYLVHWLDITRTWLAPSPVVTVQASDSRTPHQPPTSRNPWSATVQATCASGATASVRVVGNVVSSRPSCPFWIHGTTGTIRGRILGGSDRLTVDLGERPVKVPLSGAWFVDGFAGTMGELMCAIAEGRQPENSAADAMHTVRLVLAGRGSAMQGGVPVRPADAGVAS